MGGYSLLRDEEEHLRQHRGPDRQSQDGHAPGQHGAQLPGEWVKGGQQVCLTWWFVKAEINGIILMGW